MYNHLKNNVLEIRNDGNVALEFYHENLNDNLGILRNFEIEYLHNVSLTGDRTISINMPYSMAI